MDDIETLRIHHQHDGAAALVIGTKCSLKREFSIREK